MNRSLQFRLSAWLSVLIVAIALIGGFIAFKTAFHEANELQDGQLKQITALVTPRSLAVMRRETLADVPGVDFASKIVIQTLDERAPLALSADLRDGLQYANVAGLRWRIIVKTLEDGVRVVVGQKTTGRDEIARNSALATVIPFGTLAVVLLITLHWLVRRMFRPLALLAGDLDQRPEHDLSALTEDTVPSEITPFVVAINRLLIRVDISLAMQRRFVADAAHELRSPLTALSLQAERLDASEMPAAARERLFSLRRGLARTRALLNQLLTLARVQDKTVGKPSRLRVQEVFRNVLEDLMPLAEAKRLDIGVSSTEDDVVIDVPEAELSILLKNLVDNAIRYTPEDGRVDLSAGVIDGRAFIRVEDSGAGIAAEERERVFDPFYRVLGTDTEGSGLGLSIVATVAARIGAEVVLRDAEPHGLVVVVRFAAEREVRRAA
ncbi:MULTISPECIES: ATP-binding protein [unclassified Caballeronia]|uniref:ATP-binding protein n=1 Tax=unclassified Caballeronia TaxID=2646786 RepID=UPI002858C319|nr:MULTISPECIES: ATP-binding protein [unclassified Caballeronia]MDR5774172.1 ATP-binding protein [Caballeronia sp. LZ002]MDR5849607.1 ATP-binding protein [Caballeronia sp. LZ003]